MRTLVTLGLVLVVSQAFAQTPRQPPAGELAAGLQRLGTVGSVLYVAAHPDDENTRLLAWLVGARGVRAGYLSLTRGDGGQNLIGTEQDALLGLIRTHELLAARRIDGAEQRFTRARDFGYSTSAEETLRCAACATASARPAAERKASGRKAWARASPRNHAAEKEAVTAGLITGPDRPATLL